MCNVPTPNVDQVKFLLEYNPTPVLCMGLYDVLQRFCKSAVRFPPLKEKFPQTVDNTKNLFNSLDESDSFSSLHSFCSSTVKNSTITQSASKDTELWWSILNGQIRNENLCLSLCRTNEDKVNPLCSYIIWFNSLYLNVEKDFDEPRSRFEAPVGLTDEIQKSPSKSNPNIEIESNQILPSAVTNQSTLSSTVTTVTSTSTTLQLSGQPAVVQGLEANGTDKLVAVATIPGGRSSPQTISASAQESNTSKVVPLKSTPNVILDEKIKTETIPNHKPVFKIEKVDKPKGNEPVLTDNEKPPTYDDMIFKTEDGYSTPVVTKPVGDTKKTQGKHTDGIVEAELTPLEMTPDGIEMDQPNVADKDSPQPYSDEELENGDGDDIDFEPEGSAKLVQNKTIPNKSKPSSATVDQGINDPDKAYGEEREIVIEDHFIEAEDSHFFTYFLCMAVLTIMAYLAFHNKKKLLALALEGKRTRGSRRRPNSSNYSKLDCSLEEAMASSHTPASVTHVLY